MKIYAASSWKNKHQPRVVEALRTDGHEVYDFRTAAAFSWCQIDKNWRDWSVADYMEHLWHPRSTEGFRSDFDRVKQCQGAVLILPCGLSAGIEAGYIHGSGKPVVVYVPEIREAELMVRIFDYISGDLEKVRAFFKK